MKKEISIRCLPIAGTKNPYQKLMMEGLNEHPLLHVEHGIDARFFSFFRTAKKHKPDFIHLDWIEKYYYRKTWWLTLFCLPLFYLDLWLLKFTKTKLVWTFHNLKPHNLKHQKWSNPVYTKFGKRCSWIRVFDESTINKAVELYGYKEEKFKIIPEGSYVGYYEESAFIEPTDNKIRFIYTGLIKPYKGIYEAIIDLKKMNNKDWTFEIIGECKNKEYESKIIKAIDNDHRIRFTNKFLTDEELPIAFAKADFVYLPFLKVENSGSVIMAMGFKKPLISPNIGILKRRLCEQRELLYNESILEIEEVIFSLSNENRKLIGQKNFKALELYKWSDYSKAFTS